MRNAVTAKATGQRNGRESAGCESGPAALLYVRGRGSWTLGPKSLRPGGLRGPIRCLRLCTVMQDGSGEREGGGAGDTGRGRKARQPQAGEGRAQPQSTKAACCVKAQSQSTKAADHGGRRPRQLQSAAAPRCKARSPPRKQVAEGCITVRAQLPTAQAPQGW